MKMPLMKRSGQNVPIAVAINTIERKNLMINHMKRLAGALLIFSTLGAVTAYGCDQYSSCSAPDCTPYTACSGHD